MNRNENLGPQEMADAKQDFIDDLEEKYGSTPVRTGLSGEDARFDIENVEWPEGDRYPIGKGRSGPNMVAGAYSGPPPLVVPADAYMELHAAYVAALNPEKENK